MNKKIKGFLDYIGSRRFAIILLIVTTSIILIGNLIPNPALMSPKEAERFTTERPFLNEIARIFHIMNITKSTFFLVIPAFIILSVSVCTLRRFKKGLAARETPHPDRLHFSYYKDLSDGNVEADLRKRGWGVAKREDEGTVLFYGKKGDGGVWGSILFHAGMIVVIAGAIVSMLTSLNGRIMLTEGFPSSGQDLLKGFNGRVTEFPYQEMFLESFKAEFKGNDNFPVDYEAVIKTFSKKGSEKRVIKVNEPIRNDGFNILLHQYSFTPRFIFTEKKSGRVIGDDYINLFTTNTEQADQFQIEDIGVRINARFFPDFYMEEGKIGTHSKDVVNPVFLLEFFKGGSKIGSGLLPLNKKMDFDEGRYTMEFKEIRNWVLLSVSKDTGLPIVELGLLLVVVGLILRFALNEKRVWVVVRRNMERSELGGRALYFPALFEDDLKRIAEDLGYEVI